jgi:predicted RNase H-like HicB family nuclease
MRYAVVYEHTARNYSAYVPDLPGCVARGRTRTEVAERIRQAIALHIEGLRKKGLSVPEPQVWTELVEA